MTASSLSFLTSVFLSLVVASAVSAGNQDAQRGNEPRLSPADQELVSLSNRWFDALLRGDPTTLGELEGDGFLIVQTSPKGVMLLEKTAQLKNLRPSATRSPLRRELTRVNIRRYGTVAILTATAILRNETSTAPPNQAVVTEIWVNDKGQWRIVHFEPLDVPMVSTGGGRGPQ